MANPDIPRGFRTYGEIKRLTPYTWGGTTAVFIGDPVLLASGVVNSDTTTTGSEDHVGVAANYVPATADAGTKVYVYDDPDQLFECQDDGDGGTLVSTNVGNTITMVLTTGDTTSGVSKVELDTSSVGTTTSDPVIILGRVDYPGSSYGDFAKYICKFTKHLLHANIAKAV